MELKEILSITLEEIRGSIGAISEPDCGRFIEKIQMAGSIYLFGAGRSGIVGRAFAMRLMQLGMKAYVVTETTTPAARQGDLLICISGSGETETSIVLARRAKTLSVFLSLITASADSTLLAMADNAIVMSAPTKMQSEIRDRSRQLLGNKFEQSAFIFLECVTNILAERLGIPQDGILKLHANIE